MRKILALIAFLFSFEQIALAAGPLDDWPTWAASFPSIARSINPAALIARGIGTDAYYVLEVDPATGELPVSLAGAAITIDYSGAVGAAPPADAAFIGGTDGSVLRGIKTDSSGELQVDVLTAPLPTGTALDFGASSAGLRTAALLGVGTTAVSNAKDRKSVV